MNKTVAIELKNVTKTFGKVVANKNVNLTLYHGEILALLGENGSGKTTLMNMISGIYYPDEGEILIDGKEAVIRSPKDAFKYKIGMIHQHFKLVDVFSAAENIVLGINEEKYNLKKVNAKVKEISERYGFDIDPKKKVYSMAVSEKQTVEIVKVLYRGAEILILDEPTAVLTPQETQKLFAVLRKMRDDGKAIIIITHKMHEVLSVSDRVAVLRKGEYIGTVNTRESNENLLTEMMVGKKISLNIERSEPQNVYDRLIVKNVNLANKDGIKILDDVSFTARSGEILGVAGIAGSGQRELLESIAGLQHLNSGEIIYHNPKTDEEVDLREKTPLEIRNLGVRLSFVPEDRLGMGLVGNMDIVDNMMLRSYSGGKSAFLDRKNPEALAEDIISSLEVVTPNTKTPVRRLSGGNVQKVLVGREIASAPKVLMAAYPVRGLDINSSYTIYNLLNKQKESGAAVIFVGEDLDVLLELCDRIMVICHGKNMGVLDATSVTKEEIGLMMSGRNLDGGAEEQSFENKTEEISLCKVNQTELPLEEVALRRPHPKRKPKIEQPVNETKKGDFIDNSASEEKEPLVHIVKRDAMPWWKSWSIRILSIIAAFAFCALVSYALIGGNPLKIFKSVISGAFGSEQRIWILLQNTAVLLLISLAVTPAFKMKFWNIGAEGQVLVGALASTMMIQYLSGKVPEAVLVILMLVFSLLFSAIWSVIPGIFKAKWNTNETLFTLMMNYVAIQLVSFFINVWVKSGSGVIGFLNFGHLPQIYNAFLLNILIVAVITIIVYIYLKYTKQGYEISVVGESINTARYIGINVKKVIIRTTLISGLLCGIAGFLIVSGIDHTLTTEIVGGRGFTAILVSWLAKFNPLIMIFTSFLVVFLNRGVAQVTSDFMLGSTAFADIITGIMFFFIIGSEFFINYKIIFRSKKIGGKKQ